MIPRKKWTTYTPHEIDIMKTAVTHAHPDEYFTVEYAAAYLGVSPSTLQSCEATKQESCYTPSLATVFAIASVIYKTTLSKICGCQQRRPLETNSRLPWRLFCVYEKYFLMTSSWAKPIASQ